MNKQILIKKASGELEPFSEDKLRRSLERVGTSPDVVENIVSHITGELKNGASTQDIYKHAFSLLNKHDRSVAGKYSLKRAIMELGPTGHPFEKLVSEVLKTKGFSTQVGVIVQGICVSHEIDVVAEKENQHIMVECKFHNQPGTKSDVKIPLYIQARFEDVRNAWLKNKDHTQKFHEAWLVTNTKLTSDAITYAQCVGMKPIGWNYPVNEGLEVLIDQSGLHPVTCLTTLDAGDKQQLLNEDMVLCKELLHNKDILQNLGLDTAKISQVEKEINELCKII
ncbi:MAG: hypothetical protein ACD_13C00022G0029 [uncultured bacterium]|uniref:ATP-cone domain protein n=1 Tax=Candidatus Woesebacteria bacterium GW2011_GWA1_40_43 TaxID=1618553 RepID=A0A0G0SHR2_9BACT|nr:MAG: hypothetical protein ACD_13C00022G0029 [uncultured bacterium]KKR53270.1 MAG: ATP-cone domain protein [Candidatus Woesebacteria bacterium GW2011_GWD2_40_19]KKR58110.1 MAG: ATP-cone domain protein [Candidatus Woesebacteria bacterium GW2011_GWC2_40_30]KKR64354.1 MAG: ATP-cone domain protein [Candidatus Woesebacteria bacterium GW2011_GWA1_40_43]HAU64958.1 ATPase [Candidatus Woesebacteria bacterium]